MAWDCKLPWCIIRLLATLQGRQGCLPACCNNAQTTGCDSMTYQCGLPVSAHSLVVSYSGLPLA